MLSPKLQLLVSTVARLLRRGAGQSLSKVLAKQRAEDVALILRHVTAGQWRPIFEACPNDDFRAEVLSEVDEQVAVALVCALPVKRVIGLFTRMGPDDVADILGELDEAKQAEILAAMQQDEGEEVEGLLHYGEETAGGIMNPVFFALHHDTSAEDAIAKLRIAERVEMAFYIYVLNDAEQLVGVASLRQLVTTKPSTTLDELMTSDVVSVNPEMDQEEVARLASRYGFLAIPVVDHGHKMLGIVTIDDVIDVIKEEATEDILRMAGANSDLLETGSSLGQHVRSRVVWLVASAVGGLVAAMLMGVFELQLSKILPLAFFIPVVIGMGGNVGTQSSTIVVRGLAMGRIDVKRLWYVIGRESLVGMTMGVIYGVGVGVFSWLWFSSGGIGWTSLQLGGVVALSVLGSMTLAAGVGSFIPLIMERMHIDPAVATGPFVTTAIDMLGILLYFNIAAAIIPM
ncbi:MAG: magnesium transporter [bacterium]